MHPRIQNLVTGSLFAGLEIQFAGEGKTLHLVVLKKKGKKLVLEKEVSSIENTEQLSAHLAKDIPLALAFTGKGILHRRIAADPASDPKTLLSKALPNASLKEFYLQVVPATQDERFVSVLRKPAVDEFLEELRQQHFSVIACSLGPLAVLNVLPLIHEPGNTFSFGKHTLELQDLLPEEVRYSETVLQKENVDLSGQKVAGETLLAFSLAFQQLLPEQQRVDAQVEQLLPAKEDFLQKKLFKTAGLALLLAALFLLLGNYFAFSHYWSAKSGLESKLQTDGGAFSDLRNLEKQVQSKRSFLEQAGLLGPSHHAYYADQLAAELPLEIRLTKLVLAPRIKIAEEDSIAFQPGRVEIGGSCSQSIVLNRWLQNLKTKSWIKSAKLETYVQDKTMTQGEFEIALELK